MVFPRAARMLQAGYGADWLRTDPVRYSQSACADPLQGEAARPAQRRHRLNSSKRIPQPPHLEAQLPHQRIEPRQRGWQLRLSACLRFRITFLLLWPSCPKSVPHNCCSKYAPQHPREILPGLDTYGNQLADESRQRAPDRSHIYISVPGRSGIKRVDDTYPPPSHNRLFCVIAQLLPSSFNHIPTTQHGYPRCTSAAGCSGTGDPGQPCCRPRQAPTPEAGPYHIYSKPRHSPSL